jgi:O-antigen chain-terminating methyltransferase
MIEINSPKIDKKLLKEEIDNIINRYKDNPKKSSPKKRKSRRREVDTYQIEDFTKYHDIEFIKNLYRTILQREVDEEALNNRLELLRSGKRSKTEILAMVRFSKEGREKNIKILGIKKRYIMTILYRVPIISFFTKLIMLPRVIERVNRFEAHYFLEKQEQNSKIDNLKNSTDRTDRKIDNLKDSIDKKIDNLKNSIDRTDSKIDNLKDSIDKKIDNLKDSTDRKIDNLKNITNNNLKELEFKIKEIQRAKEALKEIDIGLNKLLNNIKDRQKDIKIEELENERRHLLDTLYISFEDRFRGSREDIKKRQSYYLPMVQSVLKNIDGEIIDIGSGRGEWLELLKDNSIDAIGVDLNRLMVNEAKRYGLNVLCQDALKYLQSKEENSIAVLTGFHIVEHLEFEVLISLFDEVFRLLKKGGMIIFETPNPENLMVGSCSFYTDPTHINPIPPITLQFLAENRGFSDVKIHRLNPIKTPSFIDIPNNQDVNNLIFASTKEQDYSIIGYKK